MALNTHKKLFLAGLVIVFASLPYLVFGQVFGQPPTGQIIDIEDNLLKILEIIWIISITLVIIFFVLSGFKFLTAQGSAEQLATARRFFIWAIVGAIVIILAFSIMTIMQNTLGL